MCARNWERGFRRYAEASLDSEAFNKLAANVKLQLGLSVPIAKRDEFYELTLEQERPRLRPESDAHWQPY